MPSITVLIPVFNAMPYLPAAVESILAQTMTDFEVLIVNDGSTDGSEAYLETLRDERVRVVHLPRKGVGAALNTGLEMCRSDLLARMDADDISGPERLASQLAHLRRHPEVIALGTQFRYVGVTGLPAPSPRLPCDHAAIRRGLLKAQLTLVHATLVVRTEVMRALGGYRIAGSGEDWDLFLRLTETGTVANLPDVHYLWRQHSGNAGVDRIVETSIGIEYGCHCARLRASGEREPDFETFRQGALRSPLRRLARRADAISFAHYRRALSRIGDGRPVAGYAELALAALCSPQRTVSRGLRAGQELAARLRQA